ncbi:LysR family transcriptional regulator [Sorangium sp. So ce295]|uniref:LysR family transcriptional regulator n=1 Tax=Sorangium sp. So ce295 TaxID=3133295 RepID=UPI003F5E315F
MVNLSTIDLNLLHVLAVTLEERSATRAARRLGVTQSAVSNALARARELLGDPLLVRDGRGMAPTPAADELLPELAAAMGQLRSMIEHRRVFDPRSSTRELTLACADNSQIADVPPVAAALAREMPLARLRVVSVVSRPRRWRQRPATWWRSCLAASPWHSGRTSPSGSSSCP